VALLGLALLPYQPSAFETLYQIDQACFPKRIAYGRDVLRTYLHAPGAHCIVAEVSGKAAGFILTERAADLAHIITLDVVKAYRRQSVGSLLLQAAEQEAASHGCTGIYLETATTNKAAIALWKKHGYREVDTVKNYYGRGQDAFEMLKRLERKPQVEALP
jgi:[ribosomal protein S18]-alanine N-acetyltransferase